MGRLIDLWHPQEVWLFGSRARGNPHPDSDWDLLLVVPDDASDDLLDLNRAWLRLRDLKIPVDLFPMRRRDFEEQRRHLGSLAQIATSEGERIDAR
ncbi:MAG: nucleotidyltransferase domain-containing protein [Polyangiaceae bacterium]|jgi:predicted nucleotidyltransferase|nr:nucleotidyltransferase domain-containing protein [Polyangiaceae bacterium]